MLSGYILYCQLFCYSESVYLLLQTNSRSKSFTVKEKNVNSGQIISSAFFLFIFLQELHSESQRKYPEKSKGCWTHI